MMYDDLKEVNSVIESVDDAILAHSRSVKAIEYWEYAAKNRLVESTVALDWVRRWIRRKKNAAHMIHSTQLKLF